MERRGYDLSLDLFFEPGVTTSERYTKGYIDILVTCGKSKPIFLIEAKKISKPLTAKDRDQAIGYATSLEVKVPFVVVTNGRDIHCYNVKTRSNILWDGKTQEKIPSKEQLKLVLSALKANPYETNIKISNDDSLPFRPGLALRQLNSLFSKCHSAIRKIEKNEESAFADFSKFLFLKLLEEKEDTENKFTLPYSYRFHELAVKPANEADQVKDSILSMIKSIVDKTAFGEVLQDKILLKNPRTFHLIVKELSAVSFYDCSLDSKGAAFEYFVRATLKGKKLGQYFTPRELVQTMVAVVGREKIVNSVLAGDNIKVLDPACGTGGFLVHLMQDSLGQLNEKHKDRVINKSRLESAKKIIKENVFFGSDANEGVAASAKMNMIIAGDGHTNIRHEDSLAKSSTNWNVDDADCDLILTNPPFGTSESASLSNEDRLQFDKWSSKGQHLFLQKIVLTLKLGKGEVCTVIDEGVLNTETAAYLRKWLLQQCRLRAVISLPADTFKPNKINVRSSLLYLERRESPDYDFEDHYSVVFCKIDSLGYQGSGEKIRGFDLTRFLGEITNVLFDTKSAKRSGYFWEAFDLKVAEFFSDDTFRLDYKYWDTQIKSRIEDLLSKQHPTIAELNTIKTSRGKSPSTENYVDEIEGHAIVIKSGSNVSRQASIIREGADWVEKSVYDEYLELAEKSGGLVGILKKGDVLLSSTGDGTLGKSCVFDLDTPAIADSHITVIRVDPAKIDPYYLCDYLRSGFGAKQVNRLYTGSTGMIELTPDQIDTIVVDLRGNLEEQRELSKKVRRLESDYLDTISQANAINAQAENLLNDL